MTNLDDRDIKTMPIKLTDEQLAQVDQEIIAGNSDKALDLIMQLSGASLVEAAPVLTARVKALREMPEHAHLNRKPLTSEQSDEIEKLIEAGRRDEAVHRVQKWTGKADEESEAVVKAHELLIQFRNSLSGDKGTKDKPGGGLWPFGKK